MPTLEIYEKIGEITSIHLRTAEENKRIAAEESARQAEEKRIKREEAERQAREEAVQISLQMLEKINAKAESGSTILNLDWHENSPRPFGMSDYEYERLYPYLKEILSPLGYKITALSRYSKSWTYKSGKIGYAWVSWS